MDYIFTIDGVGYNVGVVSIHRTANIKDGPNADTALSGKRWRDVQGTFYDYTMEVSADGMSREDYDAMYEVLSAPVDSHVLVAPYGQTTISFTACIEVVEDDDFLAFLEILFDKRNGLFSLDSFQQIVFLLAREPSSKEVT